MRDHSASIAFIRYFAHLHFVSFLKLNSTYTSYLATLILLIEKSVNLYSLKKVSDFCVFRQSRAELIKVRFSMDSRYRSGITKEQIHTYEEGSHTDAQSYN